LLNINNMAESHSERRLAENEVIFRKLNEKLKAAVKETNKLAKEDNQPEFLISELLSFHCECADENCSDTIDLEAGEYERIHESRDKFIIVPGHEVLAIEKVIAKQPDFYVVKKNVMPPQHVDDLRPTSVDNT
jgi:transcription initiation factor TFIID subunit TAF12